MPNPGDQHINYNGETKINPYSEQQGRVNSPFSGEEILILQSKLEKQLGPEYLSRRPAPGGGRVAYIEGWKAISLANEVFGFNGWNSEIRSVHVDFCDRDESTGRFNIGLSAIIRVSLRDGSFHEDIGYGHIENCRTKSMGFEKCRKEATTDAVKRALRYFGNALGNCLYDNNYVKEVFKVKEVTTKFDSTTLMRRTDGQQAHQTSNQGGLSHKSVPTDITSHSAQSSIKKELPTTVESKPVSTNELVRAPAEDDFGSDLFDEYEESELAAIDGLLCSIDVNTNKPIQQQQSVPPQQPETTSDSIATPVRFVSARAAQLVQSRGLDPATPPFDASYQSPSLRRTLEHNKSMPIKASVVAKDTKLVGAPTPARPALNPSQKRPGSPLKQLAEVTSLTLNIQNPEPSPQLAKPPPPPDFSEKKSKVT